MPHHGDRSSIRSPPGYCDACGRACCVAHQVGIRCYHCFAGVFVSAAYFYVMEHDGEPHAIPLPEVAAPGADALAVNVTDPPAAVLRQRFYEYEHRFE